MPHSQRAFVGTLPLLAAFSVLAACSSNEYRGEHPIPASPPITIVDGTAYDAATRVTLPKVAPEESDGLHNVYHLSPEIVSGSEPHGEDAFVELEKMGIRTILSVDGKVPDAALAQKYGMAYVHVPIQYKGITDQELLEISKTFREKQGPFYVHCFHGKHRGPAAAEVGRIVLDGVPREEAIAEMRQWCGTAQSYEGLYRTIAEGDIPTAEETAKFRWNFPSAAPLKGFRSAMVEVSRADDSLKYLSKRKWEPDAAHPDVDALNEATKLASVLERAVHLDDVAGKPADFTQWMNDAAKQSAALRDAIGRWKGGQASVEALDKSYKDLSATCNACHEVYRNE